MMTLIQNGTIITSSGNFPGDILIGGEKIRAVARGGMKDLPENVQRVDAAGRLVFPGFIDAHTHFDLHVAGTVTCDDFASGTKAAISGGTTTIIDFGTQYPGETLSDGLRNWQKKAAAGVSCDYGIHMSITEWNDKISDECQLMMDEGVTTFKLYLTYDTKVDDRTLYKVLKRLKEVGGITGVHCENDGLIAALQEEYAHRGGDVSCHYRTRPPAAEAEAIGRLLHICEVVGTPVIDVHLTCEEGLKEIRAARQRGQTVYAETCPQYLTMTRELYDLPGPGVSGGPAARRGSGSPPELQSVWRAVRHLPAITGKERQRRALEGPGRRGDPDHRHGPLRFHPGAEGAGPERFPKDPRRDARRGDPRRGHLLRGCGQGAHLRGEDVRGAV